MKQKQRVMLEIQLILQPIQTDVASKVEVAMLLKYNT